MSHYGLGEVTGGAISSELVGVAYGAQDTQEEINHRRKDMRDG